MISVGYFIDEDHKPQVAEVEKLDCLSELLDADIKTFQDFLDSKEIDGEGKKSFVFFSLEEIHEECHWLLNAFFKKDNVKHFILEVVESCPARLARYSIPREQIKENGLICVLGFNNNPGVFLWFKK